MMTNRLGVGAFAADVLKLLLFDLRFKLLYEVLLDHEVAHSVLAWLGLIKVKIADRHVCRLGVLLGWLFFCINAVLRVHYI